MPWNNLLFAGWRIVGMNHYNMRGVVHLFCSMAKDGRCIVSESHNEADVFDDLERQAGLIC